MWHESACSSSCFLGAGLLHKGSTRSSQTLHRYFQRTVSKIFLWKDTVCHRRAQVGGRTRSQYAGWPADLCACAPVGFRAWSGAQLASASRAELCRCDDSLRAAAQLRPLRLCVWTSLCKKTLCTAPFAYGTGPRLTSASRAEVCTLMACCRLSARRQLFVLCARVHLSWPLARQCLQG